jgi:hypothetical protein
MGSAVLFGGSAVKDRETVAAGRTILRTFLDPTVVPVY